MDCSEVVMEEVNKAMLWEVLVVMMSIYSGLKEVKGGVIKVGENVSNGSVGFDRGR